MSFDAGMLAATVNEIKNTCVPGRVEKVLQPVRDEIILQIHSDTGNVRLSVSASTNTPRINITSEVKENPAVPPMFCMLLRKHLTGAKLTDVCQLSFERACALTFDARDEMGYRCNKYIIAETMGKYSNIILLDSEKKIINALKIIDFSQSLKRQILPGMTYELPPSGDRLDPRLCTREDFDKLYNECDKEKPIDKFLVSRFMGISPLIAREIAYRTNKNTSLALCEVDSARLWESFEKIYKNVKDLTFTPMLVSDKSGKMLEFSFTEISQYGSDVNCVKKNSFGELFEAFYSERERHERLKARGADLLRLLTNAEARITKKLDAQRQELEECAKKEDFRIKADLIMSSLYAIKKGESRVTIDNYYSEAPEKIEIELDTRLSPAQNAQRYYKKYNKAKTAEGVLTEQIKLGEAELSYIYTVFDSLTKCESEADITEVRRELYHAGYASKMKSYSEQKPRAPKPLEFTSSSGYKILCGKNNAQNDYLTFKLSNKLDYWFHVKNAPGSHVLLVTNGNEPDAVDFTEAATVAAYYSSQKGGVSVPVDYTLIKNVKKPVGAKPGFVTYSTNFTAFVKPQVELVEGLRG